MAQRTELLKGTLDLLILKTLELEGRHGLGIAERMDRSRAARSASNRARCSRPCIASNNQAASPAQWTANDEGRRVKSYQLTASGRKQLVAEKKQWARVASRYVRFSRREAMDDLDEELRGYLDGLIAKKIRAGMDPERARREALIEFGGVENVKDSVRDVSRWHLVESIWRDLRFAWRGLRRAPGFAAVAILTLALGIGANTAIFSVVRAMLITPLPFRDPSQLVFVWGTCRWPAIRARRWRRRS